MLDRSSHFIEALVGTTHVGFQLEDVERVVRAAALHPLPGVPACLLGAVDLAGALVAVYSTRRLLGLPSRALRASDRFIVVSQPVRCAFVVDDVVGTLQAAMDEVSDTFALRAAGIRGVGRRADGVLLVQDLRRLLALEHAIPIAPDA